MAECRDAGRAAPDDRRAGHRPARLRPAGRSAAPGPCTPPPWRDELGIERILCPRASGVLCALGLAAAAPRRDVSRTVMLHGDSLTAARVWRAERDALIAEARGGLGGEPARCRVRHELRYRGQSFELSVEQSESADPDVLREAFARAHELRYGYRDDAAEVELVNIRVSVWGPSPALRPLAAAAGARRPRARARSSSTASRSRPPSTAASCRRGTRLVRAGPVRAAGGHAARAARLVRRGGPARNRSACSERRAPRAAAGERA